MNGSQGGSGKVTGSSGIENRHNVQSEESAVGETADGRQVTKGKPKTYMRRPAAGSKGPAPTKLNQRAITKQKDQTLDLKQCQFQSQVVDELVSDKKISEGLTVYYMYPDGKRVAVDPPDTDYEPDPDIIQSYWCSRRGLQSQGEILKALCAEQLAKAEDLTGEADGSGSSDYHDLASVSFTHLFTMLEEHQKDYTSPPMGDDDEADFHVVTEEIQAGDDAEEDFEEKKPKDENTVKLDQARTLDPASHNSPPGFDPYSEGFIEKDTILEEDYEGDDENEPELHDDFRNDALKTHAQSEEVLLDDDSSVIERAIDVEPEEPEAPTPRQSDEETAGNELPQEECLENSGELEADPQEEQNKVPTDDTRHDDTEPTTSKSLQEDESIEIPDLEKAETFMAEKDDRDLIKSEQLEEKGKNPVVSSVETRDDREREDPSELLVKPETTKAPYTTDEETEQPKIRALSPQPLEPREKLDETEGDAEKKRRDEAEEKSEDLEAQKQGKAASFLLNKLMLPSFLKTEKPPEEIQPIITTGEELETVGEALELSLVKDSATEISMEQRRQTLQHLEKAGGSLERELLEILRSTISDVEQSEAVLLDELRKLDRSERNRSPDSYESDPPDGTEHESQKIAYREKHISELERCLEKLKRIENKGSQHVVDLIQSIVKKQQGGRELNELALEETAYIKRELAVTCKKDIGIDGQEKISEQLQHLKTESSYSGSLAGIVTEINSCSTQDELKDALQKKLNFNIIPSIIGDSGTKNNAGILQVVKGARVSRLVQATAQVLMKKVQEEMNTVKDRTNDELQRTNEIRVIRDKYTRALKQLKTDHWGSGRSGVRAQQIYAPCIDHINSSVEAAVQALQEVAKSHPLIGGGRNEVSTEQVKKVLEIVQVQGFRQAIDKIDELKNAPNSASEEELQRVITLINQDSDFCEGLVAAFTGLKDDFAGQGRAGGGYEQRSADVMKALRMSHDLTDALSAPAVLQAVILDVSSPDSKLMPHFIAHHGGKDKAGTELRSRKVIRQAASFLRKEPMPTNRELSNQTARACFRDNALYEDTDQTSRDTVLGNFLKGVKGAELIKVPDTDNVYINTGATVNGKPLLFSGTPLSADLMGSRWLVDPSFFIDEHSDTPIPFETSDGKSRDWIPLKDSQSGKTAILAMSKKAGSPQPFFYQLNDDKHWVCHSLGASGNPDEADDEVFQGTLFAMAACGARNDEEQVQALAVDAKRIYEEIHGGSAESDYYSSVESTLTALNHGSNKWVDTDELVQKLTEQAVDTWREEINKPALRIVSSGGLAYQFVKADTLMKGITLDQPKAFQIQKAKAAKHHNERQGNVVEAISTQHRETAFEKFDRPATYDVMTRRMVITLKKEYANHSGMLKRVAQIEEEIADYGDKAASPELFTFKGCVIDADSLGNSSLFEKPLSALKEVISKSRQHNVLLFQERAHMKRIIQGLLNKGRTNDPLNRNMFDLAIKEFERNEIPGHLTSNEKKLYIKSMVNYLLLDNACQLEHQQLQGKLRLRDKLEALEYGWFSMSEEAFDLERKQWNLEMALVAGQQQVINTQLNHYCDEPLDGKNLARLSFECRAKTVLRSNQVTEVNEAINDISKALTNDDSRGMKRVSQKGTGWGKSSIVKMLSDYACAQIKELQPEVRAKRSVMIIAPKSNQAALDISLGQYFRQSERNYQRLDMSAYTKKIGWWRGDTLDRIHNTLLGLPPGTAVNNRQQVIKNTDRAPVGASIEDIQVLMQLKSVLEKNVRSGMGDVDDAKALKKLSAISDLCRESMIFGDEWDSALMPPQIEMLDEIRNSVNAALSSVPQYKGVKSEDIRTGQSTFIMGAKRKHLLSATAGSTYLLLQATGETDASQARVASHLSIEESNYRALRWINEADIVFCDDSSQVEVEAARQVVERVGSEQGILYIDARAQHSGKPEEVADKVSIALQRAREAMGGQTDFSTLHYDEQKKIHKTSRNKKGQSQDSLMSPVEEDVARRNGGKGLDTVLSQRESVGTDAPQSTATPLVHVGLLAQRKEGRLDFIAQQLGRMRCDQVVKKQPKMLVVTRDELDKLLSENQRNNAAITEAKRTWDVMGAAKKQLLGSVGDHLKSRLALKNIINQSLVFSKSISSENELENELAIALDNAEKEWENIPEIASHKKALRAFKKAQFIAQTNIKLVMAEELAYRDRSEYTIQSEKSVQDAFKKAVAETVLSDQRNMLEEPIQSLHTQSKRLVGEKVSDAIRKIRENTAAPLRADVAERLSNEAASQLSDDISQHITDRLRQSMKSIPRDILPEDADSALKYAQSGGDMPDKIAGAITKEIKNIGEENSESYIKSIDPEAKKQFVKHREEVQIIVEDQLADMSEAVNEMFLKCTIKNITDAPYKDLLNKKLPSRIKKLEENWEKKDLKDVAKDMNKIRADILRLVEKVTYVGHQGKGKKSAGVKPEDFITNIIQKISGWERNKDPAIIFCFDPAVSKTERCRLNIVTTNNEAKFKWDAGTSRSGKMKPTEKEMKATRALNTLLGDHAKIRERYTEVAKVDKSIRAAVTKGTLEIGKKLQDSLVKEFKVRSKQQVETLLSEEKLREDAMQQYGVK